MSNEQPIFRKEALRRYRERNLQPVFPRLASPNGFLFLWILLGCLISAGVLSWLTRVPVYAAGIAIVVERGEIGGQREYGLLAVLEAEALPRLQAGQRVLIDFGPRARLEKRIVMVEPEVASPSNVASRFDLGASAAARLDRPAALAWARWDRPPGEVQGADFAGSIFGARVEIGSRRLITLLPGFGPSGGGNR